MRASFVRPLIRGDKVDTEVPEAKGYLQEAIEYLVLEAKASDESLRIVQSVLKQATERFEDHR